MKYVKFISKIQLREDTNNKCGWKRDVIECRYLDMNVMMKGIFL